ncbi:MAG: Aspartate racemase [Oscillospiraceae bacterium]|nr:Aspartate racemase [Oscillospiraceae bacterium]
MTNEAKLGILGGMGPQATLVFYQRILTHTDARRDQEHVPAMILSDTKIPDRTAALLSGQAEPVFERLLKDAKLLETCGCTHLAVPCNTSHFFADRLQRELDIPLINMVRETVEVMRTRGCRNIGILATEGTVKTGIYQRECEAVGLRGIVPDEVTQKLVTSIIYDEIKAGKNGSLKQFDPIDNAMRRAGCDGAILACTELSVFASVHPLPGFYLDAMDVLTDCCITACGYPLRGN